jgi:hypothetical protein
MNKSLCLILLFLISIGLFVSSCGSNPAIDNPSGNKNESLSTKENVFDIKTLFQGEYISPNPDKIDKGSYYTDLIIIRQNGTDSLKVIFSSAKVKTQVCCSFTGSGFIKHDSLFVPLQNIGGNAHALMVISQNQQDGVGKSISVSLADTAQGDLLANFCCEEASLSGEYFPCNLSLFRNDTTKANQNTDLLQ